MVYNTHKNYTLRYAVLPSIDVFNSCGPGSSACAGFDEESIQKRNIAAEKYMKALNDKNGFYDRLEASIIEKGIRNPIIIYAGWCPQRKMKYLPIEMQEDESKILTCSGLGGSRLYYAQKMGIDVPCLINDFVGSYDDCEELTTIEQVFGKFKDQPKLIRFTKNGVIAGTVPQIHLEGK